MTVRLAADGTIELDGVCPIEDAEKLQQYLIADPQAARRLALVRRCPHGA